MIIYRLVLRVITAMISLQNSIANALIERPTVGKLVGTKKLTPNGLTMFRFVIAVILWIQVGTGYLVSGSLRFLLNSGKWLVFGLFLMGSTSDAFDGPLSRRYKEFFSQKERDFGMNFDRHTDKIFTSSLLVIYWRFCQPQTKWLVAAVIVGDVIATVLAIIAKKIRIGIPSNEIGKAKMAVQCVAIGWIILGWPQNIFRYLLTAALTLGLTSLVINAHRFIKKVVNRESRQVMQQSAFTEAQK